MPSLAGRPAVRWNAVCMAEGITQYGGWRGKHSMHAVATPEQASPTSLKTCSAVSEAEYKRDRSGGLPAPSRHTRGPPPPRSI